MGLFDFLKKKKNEDKVAADLTAEKTNPGKAGITVQMGIRPSTDDDVVSAEERIKSAFTSKNNGLYPHEILVLDYADSFCTEGNDYQQFWWYRYGVKNVDAILQKLLTRGFITIAPITNTIEKKTIPVLKELLESHGLNTKGKKAVLVQRVIDEIPVSELEKKFPNRMYMRTEKGEVELKAEEYVSYIHRHSVENLDIWSLNKLIYESANQLPYRDIIWGYLNRRSMEHFSQNNYGLYRNCRFSMATFFGEEGKIVDELEMLSEVVFFDLTGMGNNYNPEYLYIIAAHLFPYEHSLATTAPGIIKRIFDCQEKLGISDEALKEILSGRMKQLSAPLILFTIDECVDIVFYERMGDKEALDKVYQLAEKRFHKNHPDLKKNPFC